MKKTVPALAAFAFFLTSCQKEADLQDPASVARTTTAPQLKRYVEVEGTDSVAVDFTYDANGRAVKLYVTETGSSDSEIRMYRNAAGLMTRYVYAEDISNPAGDSVVYSVASDAGTGRYLYAIETYNVQGTVYVDSSALAYDAAGNAVQMISYSRLNMPGSAYSPYIRNEYTYQGKNLVTQKAYDFISGVSTLSYTDTYTYDNKTNPFAMGAEAVLMNLPTWISANNVLTEKTVLTGATPTTTDYAVTYLYTALDRPASGTLLETPAGTTTSLRYYYQ